MDVAIQVRKISLGNERELFLPVGVLKGKYNKEEEIFIDEYQLNYSSMDGSIYYSDFYFACPTTLEELKKEFLPGVSDNDVLTKFLADSMDKCYIGVYNIIEQNRRLQEIDLAELEYELYDEEEQSEEEFVGIDMSGSEQQYIFNLESLNALKEYRSVEEIRQYIDQLILVGKSLRDQVLQEIKKNPLVEEKEEETPKKLALKKEESKKFNLKDMRKFVLAQIVAQDEAVKRITIRIMANFDSSDSRRKGHLLITGGTGTGKSKTVELICNYLNIPFAKVDSTDYTQSGYVGRSVDEMLQKLIAAADGDIELAQKGILVIDEIDKKSSNGDKSQIATKAVLDSLLKITGRGTVEVDILENGEKVTIDFDTSNLTVVFTGAFEGIEKLQKENKHNTLGFVQEEKKQKDEIADLNKLLIKYGMTPELIGRIKCIVSLKKYEIEDYVQILKKSQGSPLLIEKNYFEKDKGIKFSYTSNYLKEIAKQAKERDVGVRGLESAVADSVEDIQERVLNKEPIKVLKLTKKTALNNKEYYVE